MAAAYVTTLEHLTSLPPAAMFMVTLASVFSAIGFTIRRVAVSPRV